MRVRTSLAFAIAVAAASLPTAAFASFHLMKITEVSAGTAASPNAQYVELQMYATGQNRVATHAIRVFAADGSLIQAFTFPSNVPVGTNQSKILIATAQAQTLYTITADLVMTAVIPMAGGKVCFDAIDCVAWGDYAGSSAGVGTPAPALEPSRALIRRLDIRGGATTLEATDDTGNSANDFVLGLPSPTNNAGVNATPPPAGTCPNGIVEGFEQCDDNNDAAGDGCDPDCTLGPIFAPDAGAPDAGTPDAAAGTPDAAAGTPDAAAGTPDASPGTPDAGAGQPDASGGGDDGGDGDQGGGDEQGDAGDDDDGGCGCRTGASSGAAPTGLLLVLALMVNRRSRRRSRTPSSTAKTTPSTVEQP